MKIFSLFLSGIGIGTVNSLFGSGGGLVAVPALKKVGLSQKQAQANSIAVILPLSVISIIMYLQKGYFMLNEGLVYLPFGFIGAFLGTKLMKKAAPEFLNILFSLLLIYSGMRMILR